MSDVRSDCVGGPGGWAPYALSQGWDTIAGVRTLLLDRVRLEAEVGQLQHAVDYLTNESSGIFAELRQLRAGYKRQEAFIRKFIERA